METKNCLHYVLMLLIPGLMLYHVTQEDNPKNVWTFGVDPNLLSSKMVLTR